MSSERSNHAKARGERDGKSPICVPNPTWLMCLEIWCWGASLFILLAVPSWVCLGEGRGEEGMLLPEQQHLLGAFYAFYPLCGLWALLWSGARS